MGIPSDETILSLLWELIPELYIDGLMQDCINSSALAMELLQSYTKPSVLKWSSAAQTVD